ncbi:GNAT family N-acetyltransferase [Lutispora saccharofermentans]|uniref:GNAT family N-acetyltransferase n=1 Tax=Lutispora saccharofermentans TaxID=3024236 RepID=A0ABT1NF90_9FIRM|nr:GNAT family N-acetyltransferase [Lutispora saccharofermentans]MCQ1529928.1 GNAT family N-acetyltransferase [Lutispora saccharofermentans]
MLKVRQISSDFADIVHNIQKKSFEPLLNKYHDYDINPAMESVEQIREKIDRANTTAYIFELNDIYVGWVRVTELEDITYKISALCVLPGYQNRGIAQEALKQIESYHSNAQKWTLDTIFQEKGNCHLYEKLGYVKVGELEQINERMVIVKYMKICKA